MYLPVLNKRQFVKLYVQGAFGNRPRTWTSLEQLVTDLPTIRGTVHLRNRIAGGPTYYGLRPTVSVEKWGSAPDRDLWYVSEMGPEEHKIFQGEVQRGLWGLDLYYNTIAAPMRDVPTAAWHSVNGIIALLTLQRFLCPNSYQWLHVLLSRYPDHVVEFSTYDCEWGVLPGYNTVFWECRRY